MKQIKLTTLAIVMMSCMSCVAQGIYFVSGGDFRLPALQYDVKTDVNEQTINVTPKVASNPSTFKTDGQEASFTSGEYAAYKYPSAGVHKVRIYNNYPNSTVYQFKYGSTPSHIGGTLVVSGNTSVEASWLAFTNLIFNNVTSLRDGGFQMCRKI